MKREILGLPGLCLCLFCGLITGCSALKDLIDKSSEYRTYRAEANVQEDVLPVLSEIRVFKAADPFGPVVLMLRAKNEVDLSEIRNELALQGVYIKEIRPEHE
ncbi:hypothetical protein [Mucilaginibacter segetis]|uniref:Uncharacterized protein n=1 Tax=Mucilaginibacter segetis TaxID=2793071 RepID=A0A934UME3_9SPHI|nr:hypothetical protein [Mucilaginibacter segetis]MBK0379314.1 hypothetical protein [Mucilaginibacter segetis]